MGRCLLVKILIGGWVPKGFDQVGGRWVIIVGDVGAWSRLVYALEDDTLLIFVAVLIYLDGV